MIVVIVFIIILENNYRVAYTFLGIKIFWFTWKQKVNSCLSATMIEVCMLKLSWSSELLNKNVLLAFHFMCVIFSNTSIRIGVLRKKTKKTQNTTPFYQINWVQKCGEQFGGSGIPTVGSRPSSYRTRAIQGHTLQRHPRDSNSYLISRHKALATFLCKLRSVWELEPNSPLKWL